MATHTTLPHTNSSAGDQPKRTWHREVRLSPRGGFDVLAERYAPSTGPDAVLAGHGPTREEALADVNARIAAFEAMEAAGGER